MTKEMVLGYELMESKFESLLEGIGSPVDYAAGNVRNNTREEISRGRKRNEMFGRHRKEKPEDNAPTSDVIDEMLQIIKDKESEIERLKEKNGKAAQQIIDIKRRSNAITSEMAKIMEEKGNFECINDEFANSKITEKFYKLYDNEWVHLSRRLGKLDNSLTELEYIHKLTVMMKFVYGECHSAADCQIRQFFFLSENDPLPAQNQYPELFASRRQYARTDEVRRRLIHIVWEKLQKSDEMGYFTVGQSKEQVVEALKMFFEKCIDYCWLMIVSNPPVKLEFNVIGKHHSECMEHFRVYSLKQPVIVESKKEEGTIWEVVWPSVCRQDGEICYKKGEVVILQTLKKTDGVHDNKRFKENNALFDEKLDETAATKVIDV